MKPNCLAGIEKRADNFIRRCEDSHGGSLDIFVGLISTVFARETTNLAWQICKIAQPSLALPTNAQEVCIRMRAIA